MLFFCKKPARNFRNIQHLKFFISASPTRTERKRLLIASREAMDEIHYSEFEHPNFDAKVSWLQKSQHRQFVAGGLTKTVSG